MSKFQNLVNQLTSVDLQFEDETWALLFLSSLLENWEILVVSLSNSALNGKLTTSMVIDALFNGEAWRREMGMTDQSESQALVSEESKERGRDQGRGHHKAYEELVRMANNMANRVVGKGTVQFRMEDERSVTLTEVRHIPNLQKILISIGILDSKRCNFEASGGTLRVSKGNKEMLWGRKIRAIPIGGECRDKGSYCPTWFQVVLARKMDKGTQPLPKGMQSKCRGTWRIRNGAARHFGVEVHTLRWKVEKPFDESKVSRMLSCRSYGRARPEAVRMNNLKTSDYPLVGRKGDLVSETVASNPPG
ncbi:hypothetical protein Acr_05g0005800 [Actinidia rufa]|uniref:Retrovirus-related Pol polyprotein from transposon TNT 1-94-like beta-barrel domain-containing protein n=1 Tax=Actinidia rufa TaxID=165716 RepID=A0A7J0EKE2_9ERIC|nr:hypothetical protein Acr_05g0005800 [Actinidia rufa]